MKKIILAMAAVMVLSLPVFASEDVTISTHDSLYVTEGDAVLSEIETAKRNDLDIFNIELDMDSIIPMYKADLQDVAGSGKLNITPITVDGDQVYVALANYVNGGFAGEVRFSENSNGLILHEFTPCDSPEFTLDFEASANAVTDSITDKKSNMSVNDAKLTWIEGVGYTIITEDANGEKLITTIGMQQKNSPLESAKHMAPGVRAAATIDTIDEATLLSAANDFVAQARTMNTEIVDGNPITGGGYADTNTTNTLSYSTSILIVALVGLGGAGVCIRKKLISK